MTTAIGDTSDRVLDINIGRQVQRVRDGETTYPLLIQAREQEIRHLVGMLESAKDYTRRKNIRRRIEYIQREIERLKKESYNG
jgi:hypothetical protein